MSSNVNLRDRRQITLPAEIVAAAGLKTDDQLEVRWQNGAIVMVPTQAAKAPPRSMARFQGATKGLYGATEEEANAYVRDQRDTW
jgi:bifunctional DNA-binding transcriptional regulator/antitoxin component of YhaV-PrlF toxin-antitoxin module